MEKTHFQRFGKYLLPNMVSMALLAVYTFTDSFVIGQRLGSVALGAMGICTPVITLTYAFGYFFGQGGAALYSIAKGQNDMEKARTIHNTDLCAMLIFGIAAGTVFTVFAEPVAYFLGADSSNINYIMPYLIVVLIGIPVLMLEIFTTCYVNNDGHPEITMIATIFGVTSNVALDFLFVYGFDWGMFGAAFATVFCSFLGSLVKIFYICTKSQGLKLSLRCIRFGSLGRILSNGVASLVLESSSAIVTFVFIYQAIRCYGDCGSVIYTVILNWALIAVNFVIGVAEAAQPLISLSYGQGNRKDLWAFVKDSILVASGLGLLFIIIGYGCTEKLVTIFSNDDPALSNLIVDCFRLYLPAFFIMGLSICTGSYFQAIEKAGRAFVIMLSRGIVLPVCLAFILPAIFGKASLWIATPAAELISAVIAMVLLFSYKRAEDRKLSEAI